MKVIKPQKLGVLCRTFELRNESWFVACVLVFVPLEGPRSLLPEVAMWKCVADELGKDAALDECMPKAKAEILAAGKVFAPGGVARPAVRARVSLGPIDKSLLVVGDRSWKPGLFGGATEPSPFTEMPLGWDRAFGGEGYAKNPLGKGFAPVEVEGARLHLLPNVEDPHHPVSSPGDRPEPAGFGPYDQLWPQRASKVGTYDRKWLEERFPGLADDTDLAFFNTAPEDQRLPEGHFRGDEAFVIENMHPERPRLEGRLPGVVARCFVNRETAEGEVFTPLNMRLDTVWLLPNAARGVLVYRGMVKVREHDHADVLHLIAACEDPGAPRPVEHYQRVLAERRDRQKGVLLALRDDELTPAWCEPVRHDQNPEMAAIGGQEDLLRKNIRKKAQREFEQKRAFVASLGLDPDEHGPPALPPEEDDKPPALEEIPALAERAIADAKALEEKEKRLHEERDKALERTFAENGLDFEMIRKERKTVPGGPPRFTAEGKMAELRAIAVHYRAEGTPVGEIEEMIEDPVLWERYRENERQMREAYRLTAHHGEPAERPTGEAALALRASVVAAHAEGQRLASADLTGVDLSGLDLAGIDLEGAFLECADLRGANLRGANLVGAVLTRADLTEAQLEGAKLARANLGKANLTGANLAGGIDLTGAVLMGARLAKADLREARLDGADLSEVVFEGADLRGIQAQQLTFMKSTLAGVNFTGASLLRCNFLKSDLAGADFTGAALVSSVFLDVKADGAIFRGARMRNVRCVGACSFERADFSRAILDESHLRESRLVDADFSDATLARADLSGCALVRAKLPRVSAPGARFVRADLTDAVMTSMDLVDAILQKACLVGTDLGGSNLFQADISRVRGDKRTSFKGTNLKRAVTRPVGSTT